jgi:flagellar hook-length control protein FliK
MNLGLLEGWATGGPAGPTPAPAGAADPAFHVLMDLFAVPSPVFARGDSAAIASDSAAMAGVECQVFAWPSPPSRVTRKDSDALPVAKLRIEPADEDEQAVDALLAGLFACTEPAPLDRAVALPDAPAVALRILPVQDESAETSVPAATPFVPPAPVVKQPAQQEDSFEAPQAAKTAKSVRSAGHRHAPTDADSSVIVAGAMATADTHLSQDREQPESEPFAFESAPLKDDTRKQAAATLVQAGGRSADIDRNSAMPEFATPAGRPTVNTPVREAQAPLKTLLKASGPSITFTAPLTHAVHALAASRMHAATSINETHAAASLPASTAAQIVQTIQLAWFRHGGEARITLDPQQFGDLSVAMRVDRGVVVARVQADAPQVREWLHANRDTLRAGLAEHQLRLDHLEITATDDARRESENREAGQRDDRESPPHPRRSRRHRPDQLFEIDA